MDHRLSIASWNDMKQAKEMTLESDGGPLGGFHVLDARQADFDHVLGRGLDPRRGGANTAEDRALAPGPCCVLQNPVPRRGRAGRRGHVERRERGSDHAAVSARFTALNKV